jgi:hypothetical protein
VVVTKEGWRRDWQWNQVIEGPSALSLLFSSLRLGWDKPYPNLVSCYHQTFGPLQPSNFC